MLGLIVAVIVEPSARAMDLPNIVLIMSDDQGYGDLGCYGAEDLRTPHLDQLAADGIRFTDFYANGPTCSPTRAAFLTGQYQQRIGLDNALTYQEANRGLPIDGHTIASDLREKGYATGLSGKWHLGYDDGRTPLNQGFDHFFGLLGGNHHYFQHMDRIGVPDLWAGRKAVESESYTTDLITGDAIQFIQKNQNQPFFLIVSHAAPHFPFQGPNDRAKVVEPKKKSWQIGDRKTYISMVERMDQGIGEVLKMIDELGLRDKTLVVFTSDNGGDIHARNAPFSGFKSTIQEGGIRVPCIARWPGRLPSGKKISTPAITMDWTATIRRLVGIDESPALEDGIDLMPLLSAEISDISERPLFWRRKSDRSRKVKNPSRAVRLAHWKLFENLDGSGERFLFNLKNDRGEKSNLIAAYPDIVKMLSAELDNWEAAVDQNPHSDVE
ncbi:MAG: sulfatase-like hydrolase/transferase [Verrucomicrobiales bacterium]